MAGPFVYYSNTDVKMIPCGKIVDCRGNPITSSIVSTAVSSSTYTVLSTDQIILVNFNGNSTITLPDATTVANRWFRVKDSRGNFGTSACTVTATQNIDNSTIFKMTVNWQSNDFYSDGTQYWVS